MPFGDDDSNTNEHESENVDFIEDNSTIFTGDYISTFSPQLSTNMINRDWANYFRGVFTWLYNFFFGGLNLTVFGYPVLTVTSDVVAVTKPNYAAMTNVTQYLTFRKNDILYRGNAVAISKRLALSYNHGIAEVNDKMDMRDLHGVKREGKIVWIEFQKNLVDICLIELCPEQSNFDTYMYMPVSLIPVKLGDELTAVGLEVSFADEASPSMINCFVHNIPRTSGSYFKSSYFMFNGFSGASVITRLHNGESVLVGVHVGSHHHEMVDVNEQEQETVNTEINLALNYLDTDVFEHSPFCLICEVARMPGLVGVLKNNYGFK